MNRPVPVTPHVGCDSFVVDPEGRVCLVRRADNGLWALPGGYQETDETPADCARREFREETGLSIRIDALLGVFSSRCYPSETGVNRGRAVTHLLFRGVVIGGDERPSDETPEIAWFRGDALPPLSDGHAERLHCGFEARENPDRASHFE